MDDRCKGKQIIVPSAFLLRLGLRRTQACEYNVRGQFGFGVGNCGQMPTYSMFSLGVEPSRLLNKTRLYSREC